ncbi:hypothetical protein AMAG_05467 [Allomyces macrogynus ATCC 38327]|uniref:Uncharacterized protein n=1 Tax=Allomyces macrogynus (strain ATCC 38327) TaxID=578462 RepID=A0A0L0SBV6_ALLM3|nr:hypothetical protein AMAG_05467 [Allomyces macrogynus ATCC 38327]|eukprot:KNE60028.1 hypothetical protein AMAG_05467 [Allomyces macrogynus ATCC 38327]
MGCGASKQAAEQAIPSDQRTAPGQPVVSPTPATAVAAPAAAAPVPATATPTTAAPARPAAATSSSAGKAKPTSAARSLVDPAIRSDSGIGTRHSAGSNKSVPAPLPAKPLPSIAAAPAGGAQPTAFEIPLDDAVKVKARKPMSANPRNRRRTQLQPVHVSNEELMRKIKEAEAKWDEDPIAKDKDLDPTLLRAIMSERESRIAQNRAREIEEKKARLAQHDQHVRAVADRKNKLAAAAAAAANAAGDELEVLKMSWGGDSTASRQGLAAARLADDAYLAPVAEYAVRMGG